MSTLVQNNQPGSRFSRSGWVTVLRYLAMVALALAIFAIVLLLFGKDPLRAYGDILRSTLGSTYGFTEVVVKMIPLVLCACAVLLPARIGLVNVGGEGQLYMGAWLATFGALTFTGLPQVLGVPLVIVLGFIGGGLWALIPAILRAKGWLNEVISTLLLNYIAALFVAYFVFGPWRDAASANFPQTPKFVDAMRLPMFGDTRIHLGLVLAVAAVTLIYLVLRYSVWGYDMRAIGGNPEAARRNGMPITRYTLLVMFIGGGLAGLAGVGEVMAIEGRLRPGFSASYGYIGFLISWLAGHNPLGRRRDVVPDGRVEPWRRHAADYTGHAVRHGQHHHGLDPLYCAGQVLPTQGETVSPMDMSFVIGVLVGALQAGTSVLYAALGEVVVERAGVINLGLEGSMLMGASVGFAVTYQTGNPWLGLIGAALAGALFNLVLAFLVVTRGANQLASGLALGFLGIGLSAVIGRPYVGQMIDGIGTMPIPVLADIPVLGAGPVSARCPDLCGHSDGLLPPVGALPHALGSFHSHRG